MIDPSNSPKTDWSILKSFLNNKKIPCIPPHFHENSFITDFKRKAELFNSIFVKQCSLINDNSEIPPTIFLKTDKSLPNVTFAEH